MQQLLTQSPASTYIFTLTVHCKFPSHSVVSGGRYQFFTDGRFSGASHCMCCKITSVYTHGQAQQLLLQDEMRYTFCI